jgi:hypothetical protein
MKFTPPGEIEAEVSAFAPLFSRPLWTLVQELLCGALLSSGSTITAALRALGLEADEHFANFHRVFNRARWSAFKAAGILLGLLVQTFAPANGEPFIFAMDDTLERRWGKKIKPRAMYHDPVRSSRSCPQKTSGLRWLSVHLVVSISWARRVWALPVLTALAPSERYALYKDKGRTYKHLPHRAQGLMGAIWRWMASVRRPILFVADKTYAAMDLLAWCVKISARDPARRLDLITRLRLDGRLFDPPPPRVPGKKGRSRLTGKRQSLLKERVQDPSTVWQKISVPWYGSKGFSEHLVEIVSGEALWYHSGVIPVPIRWVLIRDPAEKFEPLALMSTDRSLAPGKIVEYYVRRWPVEVTFEETNAHLGLPGQRQFSDLSIERSTPARLSLFSIVTLIAEHQERAGHPIQARSAAWYPKSLPTFSDALASVRKLIWRQLNFCISLPDSDAGKNQPKITSIFTHMAEMLSYAA